MLTRSSATPSPLPSPRARKGRIALGARLEARPAFAATVPVPHPFRPWPPCW
ncbi:hypothetical protein QWZ14_19200 [Paeniroseomonas aquatica]|uniref:Uncharacterized protein n=1 Tax=Paeniroseomonas aquatica TaxID=373043 RepID=A0ABT8AB06_9PROT|nr:hypothetical protein [Paeniroseomonas aquatica]MDN3566504.1 hypothetical protein [Paeniroseomonas aquatica]